MSKNQNNQESLLETVIEWAATRPDEVVFDPKTGFYSFEIVSDAYNKGRENMMEEMKEQMRTKYFHNAKMGAEALSSVIDSLYKMNYSPCKFFINNSTNGTNIIFSIKGEVYSNESFIDFAYALAAKLQVEHHDKNHNLKISFINDVPSFDLGLLKSDGFGFAYDFSNKKVID